MRSCLFRLKVGCLLLVSGFPALSALGQSFQIDTTFFVPAQSGLHNVSGLEFIPTTGYWHLVGDKGEQWQVADLKRLQQAVRGADTGLRLEALRYDPLSRTYFGTVEDDKGENVAYAFLRADSLMGQATNARRFDRLAPLPFDNKGIEGLALGADSTVWLAPEAGWSSADSSQSTVLFHRYHWNGKVLSQKTSFAYQRDRMPQLATSERYGGISEILWAAPNRLLVLERFYDGERDTSYAKLYVVGFGDTGSIAAAQKTLVFDFNTGLGGQSGRQSGRAGLDTR
ncbi:esterase-like activity of phytase family protein [Spirosoma utsteinense]|uniref:esterase-like activity of phytase family protein n=1 Tax=Spirosoma utsteinense TaxID=2585773 RepID=UPI0016490AE6|nr:esterase-like activity of phytase family protein [Spirosoma utsteinense]MBC3787766.1 hypothetical protein [Spirosoma utsteinense]